MKELTSITVLLDRSSSMHSIKDAMEEVLNSFISLQKKIDGECDFSLVQFDHLTESVINRENLQNVPKINILPRGSTALYDAIAETIDNLGRRLHETQENERPNKVIFIIVTDGEENSSKKFTKHQVHDRIKHQTDVYKWQFVFMGANQDAIASAKDIGINQTNACNYSGTRDSIMGMGNRLYKSTKSYRECSVSFDETLNTKGSTVTDEDTIEWSEEIKNL